jgi:hypothetical protein
MFGLHFQNPARIRPPQNKSAGTMNPAGDGLQL